MSLPGTHKLNRMHIGSYSPSIGGTPIATYCHAPVGGTLAQITCITGGVITTADCTMTVANATTSTTLGTFTVTVSGAAAGQLFTYTPDTAAHSAVAQNDVISVTPSGASGSNIPGHFKFVFHPNAVA